MKPDGAAEVLSVWRRQMELPRFLRAVHGQQQLTDALAAIARELGFASVCLISGTTVTREIAAGIAASLEPARGHLCVSDNSQAEVTSLATSSELSAVDAVIAVGGGKTIDVAKSVCEQVDLPVITVPTQLTADGIASPVSVIRAGSGAVESRHARLPIGLIVDFDVLGRSPVESARAGLGDLIANTCARARLAAGRGSRSRAG